MFYDNVAEDAAINVQQVQKEGPTAPTSHCHQNRAQEEMEEWGMVAVPVVSPSWDIWDILIGQKAHLD